MQSTDPHIVLRTRLALVGAVLILLCAIAVVLVQSAPRRSGSNGIPPATFAAVLAPGEAACQRGELIPGDTAALRATIGTYGLPGPRVQVTVSGSAGPVTRGGLAPGWRQGVVSLPVALVRRTTPDVQVCLRDEGRSRIAIAGSGPYSPGLQLLGAHRVRNLAVGLRFDYVRPGRESWLALLPTLWHRMTLAKGDLVRHWAPWGALVLMVLAGALSVAALDRKGVRGKRSPPATGKQRGRSLPWAARACVVVALANGLAWSLITPPFEVPDENAHYAYVAQLAERARLPHPAGQDPSLSPAEDAMLAATGFFRAVGIRQDPVILTEAQQQVLDALTRENLSARGSGYAGGATSAPPLYYLTQVVPFRLAPGGTVLNRLSLMRALSAVMGAITVLFIFLFLAEMLPGTPWAWTAGALAAAFQPLFGFMSGGVNYDDLQYLFAAALLLAMARVFRRGLTWRGAVEIGLALGLGVVTKVAMAGLAPAAGLTLLLALTRARARGNPENGAPAPGAAEPPRGWSTRPLAFGPSPRAALGAVAMAVLLAVAPVLAYLAWARVSPDAQGLVPGGLSAAPIGAGRRFSFRQELTHIWQLFLPHLWQKPQFAYLPLWRTWFEGFFGRLGWLDYAFSNSVFGVMLAVALGTCSLALVVLVRGRAALRRHLAELGVYAVAVAGVCVVIGAVSYRVLIESGMQFEQARYLLPLLGFYALIVALASRLGGRRWGPVVGVVLVLLALGHDVFAQLLTIQRYYS